MAAPRQTPYETRSQKLSTSEKVAEGLHHGAEKLSEVMHATADAARQTAARVAHEYGDKAREYGDKAREVAKEVVQEVAKQGLLQRYWTGLMQETWYNKAWIATLTVMNVLGGILFADKFEARVVLGAFALSLALLAALFVKTGGYTRWLVGSHAPWLALVYWLWTRTGDIDYVIPALLKTSVAKATDLWAYNSWLKGVMSFNGLALAVDAWHLYQAIVNKKTGPRFGTTLPPSAMSEKRD